MMQFPAWLKESVRPFARPVLRALRGGLFVAPGHFYSPIVNRREASEYLSGLSAEPGQAIPGIAIDRERHLALWRQIQPFLKEMPFRAEPVEGLRYCFENPAFGYGDGIMLYAMLRHFRPARLIEVGSGYSSACSMDTIEGFLEGKVQTTFIEPYPALLLRMLGPTGLERSTVIARRVQDVDPSLFDVLDSGDILFVDSTHIVKTGSDVVFELFRILPRLKRGVLIHFHDIFDGFEYPRDWIVRENRSWNELYVLRAFLMYNQAFEVLFFNDFFAKTCESEIRQTFPLFQKNGGGSLWLRKTG